MKIRLVHIKFMVLILWIISGSSEAQTVTKVLITGLGGQHDSDVKTSFELGYKSYNGTEFTGTITKYFDIGVDNSFEYADANGYQIIVRSTTGLSYAISKASEYANIQLFMPAGSNSYVYVFPGDIENCPVIVTGAGDNSNETGYKVEFYGPDPITIEPDYSSNSNGYIAGQLAFIANEKNISLAAARQEARKSIPGDSGPDMYDGYGYINVAEVINNALPVELISFTAVIIDNSVKLKWSTATEVNNYGFEIERKGLEDRSQKTGWEKIGFVAGNGNSNSPKSYELIDENPVKGELKYRLKQIDTDGSFELYASTADVIYSITGVQADGEANPNEFSLRQNYPNPFNPETSIKFTIPANIKNPVHTTLKVYSVLGQDIVTLVNEFKSAGTYKVNFDAADLSGGVYFYSLRAGNNMLTKKMILAK